ncbi:ClpP/crotonase-like domain superfamily [Sesbania bispinosa]|nr:ClpP/crotonase-like domain superfamily [Sesbania bispinosa]
MTLQLVATVGLGFAHVWFQSSSYRINQSHSHIAITGSLLGPGSPTSLFIEDHGVPSAQDHRKPRRQAEGDGHFAEPHPVGGAESTSGEIFGIGGGIDITTTCDIRFCTKDAFFSVKEVDLTLAADLGTLQRSRRLITGTPLRVAVPVLSLVAS